jgi:hypothetical protein
MVLTGAMTLVLPSLEIRAQVLTLTQGYVVPTKKVCALKIIPKFVKIRQTIMEVLSIVARQHAMLPWPFSLCQVQPYIRISGKMFRGRIRLALNLQTLHNMPVVYPH